MTCAHHDEQACCTLCTAVTDGKGFPHPGVTKGRTPLQCCPHCRQWAAPWQWHIDLDNALFCCRACAPGSYERIAKHLEAFLGSAVTEPRRKKLQQHIDRVRRDARKVSG